MARFSPRRMSRRLSTSLSFLLIFAICAAVIGEFFIEWAKENGFYERPSERMGAVMRALSEFLTQTWVLMTATFLGGITAGLWADHFLRRWESVRGNKAEPEDEAEPGMLDFIVEGAAAVDALGKINREIIAEVKDIGQTFAKYTHRLKKAGDPIQKRQMIASMAGELTRQTEKLANHASNLGSFVLILQKNIIPLIQRFPLTTLETITSLQAHSATIVRAVHAVSGAAEAARSASEVAKSLAGTSRELNRASERLSKAIDAIVCENEALSTICKQMEAIVEQRTAEARRRQPNPSVAIVWIVRASKCDPKSNA